MDQPHKPRIETLDLAFVERVLEENFLRTRAEKLQDLADPDKVTQIRFSLLAQDCACIALYYYGLGYPVEEVRSLFAEAAAASLKVFELRGTEEPLPVTILDVDPTKSEDDPAFLVGTHPLHPPGTKDYSLTNSKDCFAGICYALIAGKHEIVEKLVELMWDPPNATYISVRSEYFTPNRIHLAYAVKHLLQENAPGAHQELGRVRFRKPDQEASYMARMVRGLLDRNAEFFAEGLDQLLLWHGRRAKHPYNKNNPEMYFCLPAVALCILAMRRGLVKKTELPDDPHLPLELIPENCQSP
jgi:hypothetical protein